LSRDARKRTGQIRSEQVLRSTTFWGEYTSTDGYTSRSTLRIDDSAGCGIGTARTLTLTWQQEYPDSATICICSKHRQLPQSCKSVSPVQQVAVATSVGGTLNAQHEWLEAGDGGPNRAALWSGQTDCAPSARIFSPLDLQQQGIREAGRMVTPTIEIHTKKMIERLIIATRFCIRIPYWKSLPTSELKSSCLIKFRHFLSIIHCRRFGPVCLSLFHSTRVDLLTKLLLETYPSIQS
jgi:hypothetical protein